MPRKQPTPKRAVEDALRTADGQIGKAAHALGLTGGGLYWLLQKHGLAALADELRAAAQLQGPRPTMKDSEGAGWPRWRFIQVPANTPCPYDTEAVDKGGALDVYVWAAALGVPVGVVKRELQRSGWTFGGVLDESRRRRALPAIAAGESSTKVSKDLGFTSRSALVNAVRRWCGMTVQEYRRQATELEAALGTFGEGPNGL